jgi:hypothetical protein
MTPSNQYTVSNLLLTMFKMDNTSSWYAKVLRSAL